jgi:histidinol dehydrogenase
MTAIPARVAGVGTIACCAPPGPDGSVATTILAAAAIAGVDEVYRVGGAQAIGALAYGTESIRKVDIVVGPGSKWVSIAEREVRGTVGVPAAFAGPSEVVVVADGTAPVEWAAIDVIVQAEHGPDGFAWLVTWSEEVAAAVSESVARLVAASPRGDETRAALESGGYAVIVDDPEHAMAVVNAIAPEHLELMVEDPGRLVALVRNAGAVFVGPYAPASFGDYLAGPSHVLPTFGTARFASVLGVEDFLRRSHVISFTEAAAHRVAPDVAAIADAERLPAHAESARLRAGKPTWSAK